MNNLIKNIAESERPYERAILNGIEDLTDAELIATIIRTGTKECSSIDLANILLNAHNVYSGLHGFRMLQREDYLKIKGIGQTKATQMLAIGELSKRMSNIIYEKEIQFENPETIANYYYNKCNFLTKERMYLMLFTTAHTLIKDILISEGTVNSTLVSAREIFIEAIKYNAVYIILVHNHPSGLPEPSSEDIRTTKKIQEAGKLMDIHLSDHIIIGRNRYVSMLERGII